MPSGANTKPQSPEMDCSLCDNMLDCLNAKIHKKACNRTVNATRPQFADSSTKIILHPHAAFHFTAKLCSTQTHTHPVRASKHDTNNNNHSAQKSRKQNKKLSRNDQAHDCISLQHPELGHNLLLNRLLGGKPLSAQGKTSFAQGKYSSSVQSALIGQSKKRCLAQTKLCQPQTMIFHWQKNHERIVFHRLQCAQLRFVFSQD